jgi:hypothetical protein
MFPITSFFTEFSDPLGLLLLEEHRRRYERIRAWREAQSDPHFTEVPAEWRRNFGHHESVSDSIDALP